MRNEKSWAWNRPVMADSQSRSQNWHIHICLKTLYGVLMAWLFQCSSDAVLWPHFQRFYVIWICLNYSCEQDSKCFGALSHSHLPSEGVCCEKLRLCTNGEWIVWTWPQYWICPNGGGAEWTIWVSVHSKEKKNRKSIGERTDIEG